MTDYNGALTSYNEQSRRRLERLCKATGQHDVTEEEISRMEEDVDSGRGSAVLFHGIFTDQAKVMN